MGKLTSLDKLSQESKDMFEMLISGQIERVGLMRGFLNGIETNLIIVARSNKDGTSKVWPLYAEIVEGMDLADSDGRAPDMRGEGA